MARNSQRGSKNNNPEGKNQYSYERPFTTAAAAAAAVGAGVFLWSRRNQISEQLSNLSDQISEWRDAYSADSETAGEGSFIARGGNSGKSQSDIAEEALTLKETGTKAKRPVAPLAEDRTKTEASSF